MGVKVIIIVDDSDTIEVNGLPVSELSKATNPEAETGNYRAICVESEYPWWSVGKVYEVKNGTIIDDDGGARDKMTTFSDLKEYALHGTNRKLRFLRVVG